MRRLTSHPASVFGFERARPDPRGLRRRPAAVRPEDGRPRPEAPRPRPARRRGAPDDRRDRRARRLGQRPAGRRRQRRWSSRAARRRAADPLRVLSAATPAGAESPAGCEPTPGFAPPLQGDVHDIRPRLALPSATALAAASPPMPAIRCSSSKEETQKALAGKSITYEARGGGAAGGSIVIFFAADGRMTFKFDEQPQGFLRNLERRRRRPLLHQGHQRARASDGCRHSDEDRHRLRDGKTGRGGHRSRRRPSADPARNTALRLASDRSRSRRAPSLAGDVRARAATPSTIPSCMATHAIAACHARGETAPLIDRGRSAARNRTSARREGGRPATTTAAASLPNAYRLTTRRSMSARRPASVQLDDRSRAKHDASGLRSASDAGSTAGRAASTRAPSRSSALERRGAADRRRRRLVINELMVGTNAASRPYAVERPQR